MDGFVGVECKGNEKNHLCPVFWMRDIKCAVCGMCVCWGFSLPHLLVDCSKICELCFPQPLFDWVLHRNQIHILDEDFSEFGNFLDGIKNKLNFNSKLKYTGRYGKLYLGNMSFCSQNPCLLHCRGLQRS